MGNANVQTTDCCRCEYSNGRCDVTIISRHKKIYVNNKLVFENYGPGKPHRGIIQVANTGVNMNCDGVVLQIKSRGTVFVDKKMIEFNPGYTRFIIMTAAGIVIWWFIKLYQETFLSSVSH